MELYQEKDRQYFTWVRQELINLVQGRDNVILDIGCGEGETGYELKRQGKAKEVIGIELVEEAARHAQEKLDRVIVGDIEKLELPLAKEHFDYILMGDVLEHLIDPWQCLKSLKDYLKPGGSVIASIPNVNHVKVIANLIFKGQWEYQNGGLLDRTHLRFFTRTSIISMLIECGYNLKWLGSISSPRIWVKIVSRLNLGMFNRFLTFQYLIVAQKEA